MTQRPGDAQDISKLVEQSVSALQDVDRRLQAVRSDLAALISRATQEMPHAGLPMGLEGFAAGSPMPGQAFAGGAWGAPLPAAAPFPALPGPGAAVQRPRLADAAPAAAVPRMPAVDLADAGDAFVVQVELPGVKKDDLDILVSERQVQIRGEARPEVRERAQALLRERGPVTYQRAVPLPSEVQTTEGKAVFKDGVLTLTLPKKSPTDGPKRVDVAYG